MNHHDPEFISRRDLWLSAGIGVLFVIAIVAFLVLKGRTRPLMFEGHSAAQLTSP